MIWVSSPSVVVGKHQNTIAEVNLNYALENDIPVIRRISGGGTVYHDEGNINYSIITTSENREKLVDFHKFTKPLIEYLDSIGIKAVFEGKNNLTTGGKKFSGNSAHVYKNRVLHHGTILFDTKLEKLEKSIAPGEYTIHDKAVKSIRATVTNLSPLLPSSITLDIFKNNLAAFFRQYYNIENEVNLSKDDISEINSLVTGKYSEWDWNYGYSPTFEFKKTVDNSEATLVVEKGIITGINITGELYNESVIKELTEIRFSKESILAGLKKTVSDPLDADIYLTLFGFRTNSS